MAELLSVNVGQPRDVGWDGRTVYTGVWKRPVEGPRQVGKLNIDGDGQGDRAGHGGEQRAVLVYQIESYHHWQQHFRRDDFEYGEFGENFTVTGLADDEVCIGDRYRIGTAEFEVTQPRVTCFRVAMRVGEPELPSLLVAHHRPGFYLRVITEGQVAAGDQIVRTRTGRHALTVAAVDALLYLPDRDPDQLRNAIDIPALSPGWQQSFHELLDPVERDALSGADRSDPAWPGFRQLRVAEIRTESAAVTSIYLAAEDGAGLPPARAGQYLTVRTRDGDATPVVRSYSLSSSPGAATYRISVKREEYGRASTYLSTRLEIGSMLDVAAPRGDFVLTDDDRPVLLISAGIGVTPLLAMLHQLSADGSSREVWWIHVAHDADHDAFGQEARHLLGTLPRAHEHVFHTARAATSARSRTEPDDSSTAGRPTPAALAALHLPVDATAYLCGPEAFMADMRSALLELGLAADRLHSELFGARSAINPGLVDVHRVAPHLPPGPPGTGPRIAFARSGIDLRWSEGAASLLALAEACDIPTRWSCRTGVCHTCLTRVLSGRVTYEPQPLDPPGPEEALLCCARPVDDLVIDL